MFSPVASCNYCTMLPPVVAREGEGKAEAYAHDVPANPGAAAIPYPHGGVAVRPGERSVQHAQVISHSHDGPGVVTSVINFGVDRIGDHDHPAVCGRVWQRRKPVWLELRLGAGLRARHAALCAQL